MRGLGEGARAMIETDTLGIYAPVFCDGEKWVMGEKLGLSDCKVCIACKSSALDIWTAGACDYPDNDGWAYPAAKQCGLNQDGIGLAIKFVCGTDITAGKFPAEGTDGPISWRY